MGLAGIGYGSGGVMIYYYLGKVCPQTPGDNTVYSMAFPSPVSVGCPGGFCNALSPPMAFDATTCDPADVILHKEGGTVPTQGCPDTATRPTFFVPATGATTTVEEVTIPHGSGSLAGVLCLIRFNPIPYVHSDKSTLGIGVTWSGPAARGVAAVSVAGSTPHYLRVTHNGHCYHVITHREAP